VGQVDALASLATRQAACTAVPTVDSMHAGAGTRAGGARHAGRHNERLDDVRLARRVLEASISRPDEPTAASTGAGRVGGILLGRELDRRIAEGWPAELPDARPFGEVSSPLPTERAAREMSLLLLLLLRMGVVPTAGGAAAAGAIRGSAGVGDSFVASPDSWGSSRCELAAGDSDEPLDSVDAATAADDSVDAATAADDETDDDERTEEDGWQRDGAPEHRVLDVLLRQTRG